MNKYIDTHHYNFFIKLYGNLRQILNYMTILFYTALIKQYGILIEKDR